MEAEGFNAGIVMNLDIRRAADCRKPSIKGGMKGEGKGGKGIIGQQQEIICHKCGGRGHKAFNCPSPGQIKGRGEGLNGVDEEQPQVGG